jgi:probable rRNA maturation factor
MPSKSKVCFFFQNVKVGLGHRTHLKNYIRSVFKNEGKKLEYINYIFCTDKILLDINRQFLKHDFYTDIISFDLSESFSVVAEVYISIDRVRQNARKLSVPLKSELHRIIFHGALHLCGYKDKNKNEKKKMRVKEEFYLAKYLK